MTTFRRVPELDPVPLSIAQKNDDGTETFDRNCKEGSPLWAAYQAWLAQGNTLDAPLEPLADMKTRLSALIDATVASIYSTWMRFQAEYEAREAAAQAYKDAGYTGDVSKWISGFSDAANKTPQEAADLILQQSVSLRGALEALGALRMRKYEVLMAPDRSSANSTYASIMTDIQTVAATIH
jgi:hypothetical protein